MHISELISKTLESLRKIPHESDSSPTNTKAGFDPAICASAPILLQKSEQLEAYLKQFDTEVYREIFDSLPMHQRTKISEVLSDLNSILKQSFSALIKVENTGTVRQNNIPSLERKLGESEVLILDLFEPLITKQQLRSLDPGALAGQIEQLSARIEQREQQAKAEQRAAESAVLAKDNVTELSTVITHHETEAAKWFLFYVGILVFTFWIMIWMFANSPLFFLGGPRFNPPQWSFFQDPEDPILQAIRLGVGKIVLASFIIGICVITGRIYQTHVHNVIVNRQRRMASVAFLQLYKALDPTDAASKNNLVVQACQAIFTHSSTGFLPKGSNEFVTLADVLAEAIKKARD